MEIRLRSKMNFLSLIETRIRNMRLSFLLLLVLFVNTWTWAQYLFSSISTADGLSSMDITYMIRDKEGFLWFGTHNGLNRYDGSSVKIFNWANKNYPPGLSEDITSLLEVNPGTLLIGTKDGLSLYHTYENKFVPISFPSSPDNITGNSIVSILADPLQKIWITTTNGLFIYENGTLIYADKIFNPLRLLRDGYLFIPGLALDTIRHGIWLGTSKGLCFINYITGELLNHLHNPYKIPVFTGKTVDCLGVDVKTGDVWWGEDGKELQHFRASDQTIENYTSDLKKRYGFFRGKNIMVDSKNRVWLATWQSIILVIEPTGTITALPANSPPPYKLRSGFLSYMTEMANGEIWLCTTSGVGKISVTNPLQNIIDIPGNTATINHLMRNEDGRLVIGSENGIYIYDESTKTAEHYIVDKNNAKANRIFDIVPFRGEWWCGTGHGIKIFNPQKKAFRKLSDYTYASEVDPYSVTTLMRDSRGFFWFSCWLTFIYRYDPSTGKSIRFDGTDPSHGDIGRTNCINILEDAEGNIWVSYGSNGVRKYDLSQSRFVKTVPDNVLEPYVIIEMVQDKEKNMWMSSWGNGIFKFSPEGNLLEHLTTADGLTSNLTSSINIDDDQRIWFGTPESVQYLNPGMTTAGKINFEMEQALGDNWPCMVRDDRYQYVSLMNRIVVIDLHQLHTKTQPTFPLISGISVFEKEWPYSPSDSLLQLKYNQNFFAITFSAPDHRDYPSIQYAYFLEGFNRDWVYCGRQQTASFTNVPPGKYTFHVKASDHNGKWFEEDRQISLAILPPFWKTNWFYLLCTVLIGMMLYRFYNLRQRKQEKKKSDQIIDYFANSVYGENSVNEICWDIARNCISQLGFEDCVVYLLDEERQVLIQKAAYGPKNPKGTEILNPIEIPVGQGIVGHVAATSTPLIIKDTSSDNRYIPDSGSGNAELAVPIIHDQKVIGIIDSEHPQKNYFTEEHLRTVSTIASISSFKIADAKTEILARESEMKLLEVNKLFAESQLKALRAQMNPHFVFNCLNSIQECIVTKKYSEASAYLNKFAKLFRLVLHHSGKMLITINDEVEILTLYLELELMRFDQSFQYTVHIDPELESDDILMPSMILQPYVENALWHGLMHQEGERNLNIAFYKMSDDVFSCVVEDNGIGRKKSAELKKQKIGSHGFESKGMKMIEERLDVLRQQNYHATLEIVDKVDATGQPSGTKVIVELSTDLHQP
jgi:ligand-binding sensor domain-containing protein/putative methionine-R-sulfoxide reductase with GAF domain